MRRDRPRRVRRAVWCSRDPIFPDLTRNLLSRPFGFVTIRLTIVSQTTDGDAGVIEMATAYVYKYVPHLLLVFDVAMKDLTRMTFYNYYCPYPNALSLNDRSANDVNDGVR